MCGIPSSRTLAHLAKRTRRCLVAASLAYEFIAPGVSPLFSGPVMLPLLLGGCEGFSWNPLFSERKSRSGLVAFVQAAAAAGELREVPQLDAPQVLLCSVRV